MEVLCIHKPVEGITSDMISSAIDVIKKLITKPEKIVPYGRLIASYYARKSWMVICVWELPNLEAYIPAIKQMKLVGWSSEIVPVEKGSSAIEKVEKAMHAFRR